MNPQAWAQVRKDAVAFAVTQLEESPAIGFSGALAIAADVFDLGRTQMSIVAADLCKATATGVLVSIDCEGIVDVMAYGTDGKHTAPPPNVLVLDWSEITPQNGNPSHIIQWLLNVQATIREIRGAAAIPLGQRLGDIKAIDEHLLDNEPEWWSDKEDADPEALPAKEQGEYWEWQRTREQAADLIALWGGE